MQLLQNETRNVFGVGRFLLVFKRGQTEFAKTFKNYAVSLTGIHLLKLQLNLAASKKCCNPDFC